MATANLTDFLRRLGRGMAVEMLGDQSDRQLVERALTKSDEAALQAIVHRHGAMVYRVCWRVLQHAQDTEDAFQATFLILAQKLSALRKHASVASWLHAVAHRVAVKAKLQAAARRRRESQAPLCEAMPPEDNSWKDLRAALDAELCQLPDKWRLPLVLCYLEGRTQDEAATHLAWSKSTLRRRLEEARDALGYRLGRRGIMLSTALSAVLFSDCATSAAPGLVASTAEAAVRVAAGESLGTASTVAVRALTEGVLKTMFWNKLTTATALAIVLAMIAIGGTLASSHLLAAQPEQPEKPSEAERKPDPNPPKVDKDKKVEKKKDTAEGVLRVEFTGNMLVGLGGKIPNLTWHAYIMVNEKIVPLDFSKNEAVKKQIRDWYGDPPAEAGSTAIGARKVQVKGQMEFRGMIFEVGKEARSDGPVLVVESLKIGE